MNDENSTAPIGGVRQIAIETRTTGLSVIAGDRVIEIGCVELVNRKLSGNTKHFYVNPERDSDEDAIKVHGVSNAFLRDKPKFPQVADELVAYLRGAEVIIHNAWFDIWFLNAELARAGRPDLKQVVHSVADTLLMAKKSYPGVLNSIDALCARLHVNMPGSAYQGALLTAEKVAHVYLHLTCAAHR